MPRKWTVHDYNRSFFTQTCRDTLTFGSETLETQHRAPIVIRGM